MKRKTYKIGYEYGLEVGKNIGREEAELKHELLKEKKSFDYERAKIANQMMSNVGQTIVQLVDMMKECSK